MLSCGKAVIGILLISTVLYAGPFWIWRGMGFRRYYFPCNKSQLEFRRAVPRVSMDLNGGLPDPEASMCLLQSIRIMRYGTRT
jgi:hypothetical protein